MDVSSDTWLVSTFYSFTAANLQPSLFSQTLILVLVGFSKVRHFCFIRLSLPAFCIVLSAVIFIIVRAFRLGELLTSYLRAWCLVLSFDVVLFQGS